MSPRARPTAARGPAVIVVPYRPGGHSAKFLPPILVVLLGTAFLSYRARTTDWRGASALFESRPRPALALARPAERPAPVVPPPVRAVEPAKPAPKPEPEPAAGVQAAPKADAGAKNTERTRETDAKPAGVRAGEDPLEDIRREAEKTRDRMAELEKLKESEARKLDETAEERLRADRLDRRRNRGVRVGRVPAEQVEKVLRAQGEQLRRRMELMALLQRRQMEQMAAMRREFFNDFGPLVAPPPPWPGFPAGPRLDPPAPPDGFARLPERQGPGGPQVFRFQFRRGGGFPMDDDPPPPPPPRPRRFD